jgi:hypothetical protein
MIREDKLNLSFYDEQRKKHIEMLKKMEGRGAEHPRVEKN